MNESADHGRSVIMLPPHGQDDGVCGPSQILMHLSTKPLGTGRACSLCTEVSEESALLHEHVTKSTAECVIHTSESKGGSGPDSGFKQNM